MPRTVHILRPVVAPAAATLHRLDLRKLAFPEPQTCFGTRIVADLADGAEGLDRLGRRHLQICHIRLFAARRWRPPRRPLACQWRSTHSTVMKLHNKTLHSNVANCRRPRRQLGNYRSKPGNADTKPMFGAAAPR